MTAIPGDYDSDPGRFLASEQMPHEDVHPHVAARMAAAGVRTVLDVGGGSGRLARLFTGSSIHCLLIDLSPTMLAQAPRPAARADGRRLPVTDSSIDAVAALYTLYHYDDPREPIAEARRVLRPGGLFAACTPNRTSNPELAGIVPGWGSRSSFDGEDAGAVVESVFNLPGDIVRVEAWNAPLIVLSDVDYAAAFLRVHGMTESAARRSAAAIHLPLALTMRGCFVYATKGA